MIKVKVAKEVEVYECPHCLNDKLFAVIAQYKYESKWVKLEECTASDIDKSFVAIGCSVHDEGCGAVGGYRSTLAEAIEAWNGIDATWDNVDTSDWDGNE